MSKILETERVILRCFEMPDLDDLHRLHSDPLVMEHLVGQVRASKDATLSDLTKYIAHQEMHGFGKWAIVHRETGEFMGRAGLVEIPKSDEIDLGYALHRKFWNQGYATEISKALHKYATKKLKTKKIVGLVKSGNNSSVRVLEKIGYQMTGTGEYFGETFDVYRPNTDFYNIDQRWLASYFEMEWFDHLIQQGGDRHLKTLFPKFPSHFLYGEYHEKFVEFLVQTLSRSECAPKNLLEVGSSLGRIFYEICKSLNNIQSATLVEPSQNFFQHFKKILNEKEPIRFPVVFGYEGESEVQFNTDKIKKVTSPIKVDLRNDRYENLTDLPEHDLVVCSNVIDQCNDPKRLVEFLKNHTATNGVLAMSCTYQWKKGFLDFEKDFISNVKDLFGADWSLIGETEIEYRVRSNERHWLSFQSHVVIYRKTVRAEK